MAVYVTLGAMVEGEATMGGGGCLVAPNTSDYRRACQRQPWSQKGSGSLNLECPSRWFTRCMAETRRRTCVSDGRLRVQEAKVVSLQYPVHDLLQICD